MHCPGARCKFEIGNAEQGAEATSGAHTEHRVECWPTQIGVHKYCLLACLREAHRQVGADRRFALANARAGDQ